jgi:hypothetical protein
LIEIFTCTELPARMVQSDDFRPVDWRWQRAQHWSGRTDRQGWMQEDEWTREAAIALRPRPVWYRPPAAFALRLNRIQSARVLSERDVAATLLRQAWILADVSLDAVAEKLNEPVEAIEWYERLFFDVRGRLDSLFAMMRCAIGPQPPPGRSRAAWALRYLAYFGGPVVLEAAWPAISPLFHETTPSTAEIPPALQALIDLLQQDWNPPHATLDLVQALQPVCGADSPTGPRGSGWPSAAHSQLAAALAAVAAPPGAGQTCTA